MNRVSVIQNIPREKEKKTVDNADVQLVAKQLPSVLSNSVVPYTQCNVVLILIIHSKFRDGLKNVQRLPGEVALLSYAMY